MQRRLSNVLYSVTSSTGSYVSLNFDNASLDYFDSPIKQEFDNILIDNIGSGDIRFSLKPGLDLTSSIVGAKTLISKDSIYIQEHVTHITFYFISTSTIELVLILDLDDESG